MVVSTTAYSTLYSEVDLGVNVSLLHSSLTTTHYMKVTVWWLVKKSFTVAAIQGMGDSTMDHPILSIA